MVRGCVGWLARGSRTRGHRVSAQVSDGLTGAAKNTRIKVQCTQGCVRVQCLRTPVGVQHLGPDMTPAAPAAQEQVVRCHQEDHEEPAGAQDVDTATPYAPHCSPSLRCTPSLHTVRCRATFGSPYQWPSSCASGSQLQRRTTTRCDMQLQVAGPPLCLFFLAV